MGTGSSQWDEGGSRRHDGRSPEDQSRALRDEIRSRWAEGGSPRDEGRSRWAEGGSPRDEGRSRWTTPPAPARYAASKVPLITGYFWVIKLLSTAMGEATSDYMVRTINPVIAVLLGFTGFVIAMVLQLRARAYNAWVYWLAVVMVAVFGTQAADVLHIKFGVPYTASTAFYAVVLVVIFVLWYRAEGTLSIHSIRTPRRELFYWATVLATFAMGTATGDMTARTLNLGYLASGIWFTLVFASVAVAHWKFRLNPILAFWIAYVLTRPVGASFADYVAFPRSVGGLAVGHGTVALVLTFMIIILVGYLVVTRKDVEDARQAAAAAGPARGSPAGPGQPGYPPGPGQRHPGERYPGRQYPGQQHPGQHYPERRYRGERHSREPRPAEPYPDPRYPPERRPGEAFPHERWPEEASPREASPLEAYPREPCPGQGRRGQQHGRPGQGAPSPPRAAPQPPSEPWPPGDQRPRD